MEDLGVDLLAVGTNFKLYFAGGISSRDITLFACTKYSGTTFKSSKPRYDFVLIKEDWTAWNKGMVRVLAQILLFIVIEVHVKSDRRCCSIASCIGYFELFCALLYAYCTVPTLLCHSVYRSTAQRTVYLHRQELSVIDGQFCS